MSVAGREVALTPTEYELLRVEHCALSLIETKRSDHAWKWVVLSLHSALQGAMICHLSGTASVGALTKRSGDKWHAWHEKDRNSAIESVDDGVDEFRIPRRRIKHSSDNPPQDRIADAKALFERLTSPSSRLESTGGPIAVASKHRKSFRRLHDLRNDFTHFSPKGWSIEVEFIRDAARDVLDGIDWIEQDDWPFRHMEGEDGTRLREKISELRLLLSEPCGKRSICAFSPFLSVCAVRTCSREE